MDNKSPCYGCERRKPLCHGSCEEYKAFAKARADRSRIICKKRAEESAVTGVLVKAAEKTMKEKRKG
jgi:hypothetical protein